MIFLSALLTIFISKRIVEAEIVTRISYGSFGGGVPVFGIVAGAIVAVSV